MSVRGIQPAPAGDDAAEANATADGVDATLGAAEEL
jgi:hypothetical protein